MIFAIKGQSETKFVLVFLCYYKAQVAYIQYPSLCLNGSHLVALDWSNKLMAFIVDDDRIVSFSHYANQDKYPKKQICKNNQYRSYSSYADLHIYSQSQQLRKKARHYIIPYHIDIE